MEHKYPKAGTSGRDPKISNLFAQKKSSRLRQKKKDNENKNT